MLILKIVVGRDPAARAKVGLETGRYSDLMDRRAFERHPAYFHATITRIAEREQSVRVRVNDISKAGICVVMPLQLPPGDMVQLELADSVLFGHVIFCNPQSGDFRIGIEVERVLLGGTDLSPNPRSSPGHGMFTDHFLREANTTKSTVLVAPSKTRNLWGMFSATGVSTGRCKEVNCAGRPVPG